MSPATTRPVFEPLEQRLLYSADFSPAALAGFGTPDFGEQRLLQAEDVTATAQASLEIAFVDMSLPDAEGLITDLLAQRSAGRPIEVVRIGSDEDGIARIGEALDGRSGITAMHVLSHGGDGAVQLGNARLDASTLLARAGEMARWGSALSGDADLLLYGCDVAASAAGEQLVANLAVLTGADVAASTDLTGAASRGGDWSLEHRTGEISATTALSFAALSQWQGVMATFTVTTTVDTNLPSSLRWAITEANASLGSDIIVLGPGTYTLSVPGLLPDDNLGGDLDIAGDVSIVGAGAGSTVIDGNGLDRVFDVRNGDVSFSGLTIQGGATINDGGAVRVAAGAGASLSQSILQGNSADYGGAIASFGTLSLSDVEIRNNTASNDGGGVSSMGGTATLDRVTLAGNQARKGGAIDHDGALLSLTNVTMSGNTALNQGGALHLDGDASLLNVTAANNTAQDGGGIYVNGSGSLVTLQNTLLANNGGGNGSGTLTSLGHNLSTDGTAGLAQPTDRVTPSAGIAALADNGGFTRTHALLAGSSAALNSGDSLAAPATDQRGAVRIGAADIGAFEGNSAPTISAIADQSTAEDTPIGPIAFTIGDAETTAGGLIVSASSSDAAIIASAGLVFGGSGANRTLTVTPVANASGAPVTITVNVWDGAQTTSTTFTVTVGAVNDAPLVSAIALGSINEDASRLITQADLLAGASDVEGDAVSAVNLSLTAGSGALVDNGNGTWTFTPAPDWNGAASFSFGISDGSVTVANSASLTVSAINDAPTVAAIDLGAINEDASRLITQADLLAGASDVDGGALSAINLTLASGSGALVDNGNGTWTFTPAINWNGAASFSFAVSDGGVTVANAASLAVVTVDDPPAVAAIDLGSTTEDTSRLITQADLLTGAGDPEGDALSAANLGITSGSGTLIDNGNGTWIFTPVANWNGAASFGFNVFAGAATTTNSASLTVSAVNDAPAVAPIDLGAVDEDTSRLITQAELLAGATDADGDALFAKSLQLKSTTGTLVDNGNGTWTYTPQPDWNGVVAFAFDVSDGVATSSTQAVLDVRAVNDAPVITSDGGAALADVKIAENSTAATSVMATDADAATVIRFAIAGGADAARFTIDAATGKLAFLRAPDHEQPADTNADNRYEVIVTATDGSLTAQQLLRVEVGNVDEAPAIVANSLQVSGSGATLILRGADTDSAAGVLEFNVTAVAGGRFEHAAAPGQEITTFTQADIDAGAVRFVPDDGAAAIDYRLSLNDGVSTVTSAAPDVVFTLAPKPVAAAPAAAPEVSVMPPRNGADPESTPVSGTTDSPLPAAPDPAIPSFTSRAGVPPIDVEPVEFEPMRTTKNVSTSLPATSAALRSLDAPVTASDLRFSLPSEDGIAFEPKLLQPSEVADALRERELAEQLDRVRDDVTGARGKQQEIVASTLMLSTGLSVGYVLWLGRGGVLLASLLSALPAWSTLDPLPVLAQLRRRDERSEDETPGHDDPIETLFSKARQLLARGRA